MRRTDSYTRKYSEDVIFNKNVEWMKEPAVWFFYPLVLIGIVFAMTTVLNTDIKSALTYTNVLHAVVTFPVLHWIKGSADFYDQGQFNGQTLWEQLDPTGGFEATQMYLTLVPTVLTLAALMNNNYAANAMYVNVPVWLLVALAKAPYMYRVRLFGINSTPVIDDEDKLD